MIEPDRVLELLADEYAREILQYLEQEPHATTELIDRCEFSRVTVYRRLNDLEEAGIVSVDIRPALDGNHKKVYTNELRELTLSVSGDGFEGRVSTT